MAGGRDLRVNLLADVSKFARNLRSAEGDAQSFGSRITGVFKGVGIAAAGAVAAIGATAIAVGVDAVKAAIEEEQSVGKLTTTLKNLGLAHEDTKVEQFIDDMQFATGVADNQLRPAYDRLIRSTGDVEEANRALAVAQDIATAKGLDVKSVADVLGKAYDGNTMALGRMGVGIDRTILKSGDMGRIIQTLIDKFGGQASAAAGTLGGAIQGVQIGWDELVESFGQGLVGDTAEDIQKLKEIQQQLRDMQPSAERAGEAVRQVGVGALTMYDRISTVADAAERGDWSQVWDMFSSGDDDAEWQRKVQSYRAEIEAADKKNREASASAQTLGQELIQEGFAAERAAFASAAAGDAIEGIEVGAVRSISALQRLQGALDGIYSSSGSFGKAQEKFAQGIAWTQLLAQGPGKSGSAGTGKNQTAVSTKDDFLNYANQIVSQAVATAKTLGPKAANKLLQNAQDRVTKLLGQAGYDNARAQAAQLIGPVNINPNPRPWEQMYRDRPTSNRNVDPSRTATRRRDESDRANSRSAQRSAKTRARP